MIKTVKEHGSEKTTYKVRISETIYSIKYRLFKTNLSLTTKAS